jgi:UDP-N-acetylglucosamine--N-acetylmuramyl-(pentapeptide) pyrophosphoryl-undecaprenol N-acetylglucosamine transferase
VLGDAPDAAQKAKIRFVGRRWDMTSFYSLCDAVICRAGASTLAELAAYKIPTLTIPWKEAADGHQEANARCFVAATGNLAWFEGEEKNEDLEKTFLELLRRARKARNGEKEEGKEFASEASLALWRLGEEKLRFV